MPFNDESFDCVLAVTVLCFVQEAERAVAEMARVLRPGGHLLIGELGDGACGPFTAVFAAGWAIQLGEQQHSARAESFAV